MLAPIDPGNAEAVEAWNTVLFEKFSRYRAQISIGLALHGDRALDRLAPPAGSRVIDLGCGFGDTTRQLAARVGPTGHVVGVDAASRYLDVARAEAANAAITYVTADLEAEVPDAPYDFAFARFGTMFFARPVLALRNIRRALVPGGKLCMVVWRAKAENECFILAEEAVRAAVGSPPKGDHITCGPGPFSMASADVLSDQLLAAGFSQITLERSDAPLFLGATVEDAVAIAIDVGPAGELVRLAGSLTAGQRAAVEAAVADAMRPLAGPRGVFARSTTWIVMATTPLE